MGSMFGVFFINSGPAHLDRKSYVESLIPVKSLGLILAKTLDSDPLIRQDELQKSDPDGR